MEEYLLDTYGTEMIFEEDAHEEDEEIQIEDFEQVPLKFEGTQPQVCDLMSVKLIYI